MTKRSAGILLYRFSEDALQVFLAHPGGPFWQKKDDGWWTIPKGEIQENESPLDAAKREFFEETGIRVDGHFQRLTPVRQKSGKVVMAFALEGNCDASAIRSNLFELEHPPKSGIMKSFPEIDKADWFQVKDAKRKLLPSLIPLLDELQVILHEQPG